MDDHCREFDCIECGRHIIVICGFQKMDLCAVCVSLPGWFNDPKLKRIFAGDDELNLPAHEQDVTP